MYYDNFGNTVIKFLSFLAYCTSIVIYKNTDACS